MSKGLIWLVNPYGNIPGECWSEYRFSMIARCLSDAGYHVRWFVANFEHRSKTWRKINEVGINIQPGYDISIIESSEYKSHVSIKRILFERTFANNVLNSFVLKNEKPDLIIFGEPALFVADIYKQIAMKSKSHYIVDILDLWPEIFVTLLPPIFTRLEKFILLPFYLIRSWFFKDSIGFTAVAPDYLDIIGKRSDKVKKELVYIGISNKILNEINIESDSLLLKKKQNDVWLVYAGTLGRKYDIECIIKLADRINSKGLNDVKIVVAGDGEMKQKLIEYIDQNNDGNLLYIGKLSLQQLAQLYEMCDIAISSYVKRSPVSMPLKAFDYFFLFLPLINSLDREVSRLVQSEEVGIQYEAGNIDSMWSAFLRLYENKDLRINMSKNSKELGKRFTFERQYIKYVNFVNDLLI